MATCEYDLDTSGGLMEEIQRLVAPPVSEEALKKQKRGPKEYRRHGKAINHDYCDSCLEGGDLLCCDQCPVSFHLQCHDPPLEEDDVPTGEWVCHRCKVAPKLDKDDDASSTKSGSSGRSSKYIPPMMPIFPLTSSNPLQQLAEAAKLLNPVQFDLPKDIACTTPLPGSSKRKWWGKDKNIQKKQAHELDNGMVPLPAKVCFICRKSCRVAPLLPCDYCPCLFHLDCLEPPLTAVPTGRWMCPNHIENAIDEKLVQSVSLTERVKLWDKFDDRINHHAVKVEFLKKAHRKDPPFRIKYRHPRRRTSAIPAAIKEFYERPTDQLSPPTMSWSSTNTTDLKTEQGRAETSLEDQEQWLKSVVSLQTSIAQFLTKKQLERGSSVDSVKSDNSSKPEKPTASVQPVLNRDFSDQSVSNTDCNQSKGSSVKSQNSDSEQILTNGPLSSPEVLNNGPLELNKGAVSLLNPNSCSSINGDLEISDLSKSRADGNVLGGAGEPVSTNVMKVSWPNEKQQTPSGVNSQSSGNRNIVISTVNKQSSGTYSRVVSGSKVVSGPTSILSPRAGSVKLGSTTLARSNSQSGPSSSSTTKVITVSAPSLANKSVPTLKSQTVNTNQSSAAIITLNNTLQQCLDGGADLELSKLDEKLIQILAWQRLQQLMPSKSASEGQKKATLNGLLTTPGLQDVQARAVLCPLSGRGEAVPMPYRTLSIGTGADMDVCLGQFGQCNFISAKHAFIFYDETSKHYELLNYSEHGTTVDNVLYSCDFSDKPATTPQPTAIVASVRNLIKDRPKMKADERLTMTRSNELRQYCNCRGSSSSMIGGSGAGWEGTALLHHGSYIKVGCIQFVFSIVDHATNQPVIGAKREPMSLLKSHLKGIP